MRKMRAVWHNDQNFGDALTPYIIEKMYGYKPQHTEPYDNDPTYMVTGSLLDGYISNSIIWGIGIMYGTNKILPKKYPPPTKHFKIIAVRGPISFQKCIEAGYVPKCIGDPSLLLPKLYNPERIIRHKLGIIPSWVDLNKVKNEYHDNDDVHVIDVFKPVEQVINEIVSCETTIASALHGLIVSIAYGISTRWVEFSDNIAGDGTKYKDFLQSIKMNYNVTDLRQPKYLFDLPIKHELDIDLKTLWNTCPFKRSSF